MKNHSSSQYIADLGEQLERHRLLQNIAQADLAEKAGISTRTLRRLESGEGGTLDSFIRLLIGLNIDSNLSVLIPDSTIRPIERTRRAKAERMRASGSRKSLASDKAESVATKENEKGESTVGNKSSWAWGDEKP